MARCASVAVTATDHSIFTSRRKPNRALPPLRLDLLPELLLLLADLAAGIAGREVRRLEDLADLHLGILEGGGLEALDRLLLRLHLPEPEAGDQLLRLRERPVDHGPLACGETDASTLRARLQALAGEHHPRLHQLFVELPHGVEDLLVRKNARLRVLVGLHNHHETHRRVSLLVGGRLDRPLRTGYERCLYSQRRATVREIDTRDAFFRAGLPGARSLGRTGEPTDGGRATTRTRRPAPRRLRRRPAARARGGSLPWRRRESAPDRSARAQAGRLR